MIQAIKGHIIESRRFGELTITENGYLVCEDGVIRGVFAALPESFQNAVVSDFTDRLVLQSYADMHLHAPQYPMLGMGMDLPLLEWLKTYTFSTEARFADDAFARECYHALAQKLIDGGTTRVCMFSSLHASATRILMEELENAGVTGYVGKVNMDADSGACTETTESSMRETLRFLDECSDFPHVKPILTPRFIPSCSNELLSWLGEAKRARGLYVQSHLSENHAEIALVKRLHPDCAQYWEAYERFGLFADHTVMAHCVHSDAREREAMITRSVYMAHCPDSNINICSGFAPVRQMLTEGGKVVLGSDIAGGAQLYMGDVLTSAIRASKARAIETDGRDAFLTVAEAYYLATGAGAEYFGAGAGFGEGDELHAIVISDEALPETVRTLSVKERFERAIYLAGRDAILAVYSAGRRVK